MTLGIGATIAVDWAYQSNWKGIKDKTDWIGNKIDNGIDTAKDKLVEGVKKKREIQEYATNKVSNIVNNTVKSVKKEVAKEAEHVVGQAIEKAKDSINPMRWQW
ncbi:hypothetical protein GCM10010896_13170 [Mammaliicoccus stepanovicii]|uniref:Phage protein n=1 Tax=Mammaliicoccus stepanovicii TaxID=643214 RepID=A0A239ZP29_9STAP|nr:hypothetical protein GCM10010896_13170 [Mammaliicoccus stepanovicii]SNV73012.1 Phage protein [Mammaliicoccus stepanovicii]